VEGMDGRLHRPFGDQTCAWCLYKEDRRQVGDQGYHTLTHCPMFMEGRWPTGVKNGQGEMAAWLYAEMMYSLRRQRITEFSQSTNRNCMTYFYRDRSPSIRDLALKEKYGNLRASMRPPEPTTTGPTGKRALAKFKETGVAASSSDWQGTWTDAWPDHASESSEWQGVNEWSSDWRTTNHQEWRGSWNGEHDPQEETRPMVRRRWEQAGPIQPPTPPLPPTADVPTADSTRGNEPLPPKVSDEAVERFNRMARVPLDVPDRNVTCQQCKSMCRVGLMKIETSPELKDVPPMEICEHCYSLWVIERFSGGPGTCTCCQQVVDIRFYPNTWMRKEDWGETIFFF